jgi:hypothetical protein
MYAGSGVWMSQPRTCIGAAVHGAPLSTSSAAAARIWAMVFMLDAGLWSHSWR